MEWRYCLLADTLRTNEVKMGEEIKSGLPQCGADYINLMAKKVRYRRKVRAEVREELTSHFTDALHGVTDEQQRIEKAMSLIKEFGDPKMLAKLIRRGKKRCRPLWLRAFIRTCQVFGVIILLIIIRLASLSVGTPGHAIDHYAKLTELGRGELDNSQNAQPVLDKAASVMVETPKWLDNKSLSLPLDMNDVELAQLKGWLASNEKAIGLVRDASRMPGRWIDYHPMPEPNTSSWASKGLGGIMFSAVVLQQSMELSSFKELVYMLRWNCLCEAQDGRTTAAIDDALALVRLGALYEVGIAVEAMGEVLLYKVTATGKCDTSLLADTQARLQRLYREHQTVVSMGGEKVFWDEIIQSSHTDSGRMFIRAMPLLWRDWSSSLKGFAFGFPSKADAQKTVDDYFGIVEEAYRRTPWQRHAEAAKYEKRLAESGTFMLRLEGPALVKIADLAWQAKAQRGATLTILATERWRLDKGSLPAGLDELVKSGYLTELPVDPWSDKPLVYRKTADGYTLYSVGPDFQDNGGAVAISHGKAVTWSNNAASGTDVVFWPVPK
jgi:hypothetical protein